VDSLGHVTLVNFDTTAYLTGLLQGGRFGV
jgi:hypothetical protein